jgi:3-polyprenyl-4-hydroxybenzoate decarboxylase
LARALDLGPPRSVAKGDFLEGELTPGRERVLVEIARTVSPETEDAPFPRQTYKRLLSHRVKAEEVIGFNRSVLECSIPVLAGVMLAQERVAASLGESLNVIDGWLCRLMDPEGRTFTESELVTRFGWPDVDVRHQEAAEAWGE